MALSKTDIANLALTNLRETYRIQDIETEDSEQAELANLWYDTARLQTLELFDWGFASVRLTLATHAGAAPSASWAFRYQYPADCAKFREIVNPISTNDDSPPYEVEQAEVDGTKSIVTDVESAVGRYTKNETNVSMFTANFVICLSYNLAQFMASISTDKNAKTEMMNMFYSSLNIAGGSDANEGIPREERDAGWIRGR